MLAYFRKSTSLRSFTTVLALAALLLSQGMRLCLDTPAPDASQGAHAAAPHLESTLFALGDPEDGGDRHISLGAALIKQIADGALAVALVVILLTLLPRAAHYFLPPTDIPLASPGVPRLRPPLRAPPR